MPRIYDHGPKGIGDLSKRVTFQRKIKGTDVSNQHKPLGWANVPNNPTVYAYVEENSGTEVFQADQLNGITVANIYIRHRDDLTIQDRVVYNGKNYDIHAITEWDGRKNLLKLTCESGGQYK
jgi:SPP1 family predicted phage head-tail adaptor